MPASNSLMQWPDFMPTAHRLTPEGTVRRFGFEVEFGGIDLEAAAHIVSECVGAPSHRDTEYEWSVSTDQGTFKIERDVSWLKKLGRRTADGDRLTTTERIEEALLAPITEEIMPAELVAPPLRWDQLEVVDEVARALGRGGARGTQDQPYYAFGVHINPEVWSVEVADLLATVRAFSILQRYLIDILDVNRTRRITPYITPYPDRYLDLVLDPQYEPDQDLLIDDYLRENPTRGRALDMLVLFGTLDEARVRRALPDEKIRIRPTYHYRLPDSRVGVLRWSVREELRSWALVEHLACDRELLEEAMDDMRAELARRVLTPARPDPSASWMAELRRRLQPPTADPHPPGRSAHGSRV